MGKFSNFEKKDKSPYATYEGKYIYSYYDLYYGSMNRGNVNATITINSNSSIAK